MSWPDFINGSFESFGGVMMLLSCWRLFKDKTVKGVSIPSMIFFTVWGTWNLYYYPHLDQWLSFFGGVFIWLANMIWVSMVAYYYVIKKSPN